MVSAASVRVAIDIETTGLQVESDSIIEIGAVKFRGTEILETLETFVEARRPLPYRIQRLTHITPAMLVGAPAFASIAPQVRALLGDLPLVGHSVGFDASFLRKMHLAERNALLDTFELASLLLPTLSSYSLERVAEHLQLSTPTHHRALADAVLSRDVLLALEARIAALPDEILQDLCELAPPALLPSATLLQQERQRRSLSMRSGGVTSIGQALNAQLKIDPAVLNLRVAALEAPAPTIILAAPATDDAPQRDPVAAATVTQSLSAHETGIVELAPQPNGVVDVLVPALQWAISQHQRLVIAVGNAAAARTLAATHLPSALAALGVDGAELAVATLFEPQEYLCLHRWYGPLRAAVSLTPDAMRGFAKLTMWAYETATGARDEVTLGPTENAAWRTVRGGAEFVAMADCAYRKRGWCFARRAQVAAESAAVVITTHAALFAQEGPGVVPPADGYLVLDAQQLADEIIDRASFSLDAAYLAQTLHWLWRRDEHGTRGLLARAVQAIPGDTGQQWANQVARTEEATRTFFQALTALPAEAQPQAKHPAPTDAAPFAVRLDDAARALPGWGSVADAWHALEKRLNTLVDATNQAVRLLAKVKGTEALAAELAAHQTTLRHIVRQGREGLEQSADHMVYLVRPPQPNNRPNQRGPRHDDDELATLQAVPIDAAHLFQPIWQRLGAGVVLAGTTLAVEGRFAPFEENLGLVAVAQRAIVPTDRARQTLLLIPTDAPEPNMPAYQRTLNEAIIQVAAALQGRTVVLFASHTALRTTYFAIKPLLEQQDIMVLGQGQDGSLRQMWQNYRTQERLVLLGAGGMWEGWEAQDARPTCLFIPRLPLPALGDPIIAARAERFPDALHQFTVPHAALRVRQALNTLAWSHTDRNIVVLYDTRVVTKEYGATILNTLPPVTQRQESTTMLGTRALEWLE
jgi:DNA polymerase III epsilon subunit family exonuclease